MTPGADLTWKVRLEGVAALSNGQLVFDAPAEPFSAHLFRTED